MSADAPAEPRRRTVEIRIDRDWIPLLIVLAAGLLVRFWAMRWPPFETDVGTYIAWGERMRDRGPGGFYDTDIFVDYAPGYMYVLWFTTLVRHWFFEDADRGTLLFLFRFPSVVCDLAASALIYVFVLRRFRERVDATDAAAGTWAALAAACYAFNPAIIFNSAAWGQTDSVPAFLLLLSLLLLLWRRAEWSVVAFAIAFLIKPQSITLAPLLGVALLMLFPPRRVLTSLGAGLAVGVALLLPFFGFSFVSRFLDLLRDAQDVYPYSSVNAYNLWGIHGFFKSDLDGGLLGMTPRTLGLALYIVSIVAGVGWLVAALRRSADHAFVLFMFATYFTFVPIVVLTRMHERYFYPVFPFLLVFAVLCQLATLARDPQERRLPFAIVPFLLYVAVAVLHTMNLYWVYEYYRFQPNLVPETNRLYYRIAAAHRVWSTLTVLSLTTFLVFMPSWLARLGRSWFTRDQVAGSAPAMADVA